MEQQERKILLLEKKVDFLQEKIDSYEKDTGPLYHLLPIRLLDIALIEFQDPEAESFLLAAIVQKKDTKTNVIKISKDVLQQIASLSPGEEIMIDNYILTDHVAEKRLKIYSDNHSQKTREWIWKLI